MKKGKFITVENIILLIIIFFFMAIFIKPTVLSHDGFWKVCYICLALILVYSLYHAVKGRHTIEDLQSQFFKNIMLTIMEIAVVCNHDFGIEFLILLLIIPWGLLGISYLSLKVHQNKE